MSGDLNDLSNGYEAVADEFIAVRSDNGRAIIQNWAAKIGENGTVIDIGAGAGEPLTAALIDKGLSVWAIDASPTMVAAFQQRFAGINIACESVENSRFFDRKYDAVLMIGLIFLLPAESQGDIIRRLSVILNSQGRLLFSAPAQLCEWDDILTGRRSVSLGAEEYLRLTAASGMKFVNQYTDEGGTVYYEVEKE